MRKGLIVLSLSFVCLTACQDLPPRNPAAAPFSKGPDQNGKAGLVLYHQYYDAICSKGFSDQVSPDQLKVITNEMANRDHRIWHYFWHATRNSWHELSDEQKSFFLSFDPRWNPTRLLGEPRGVKIFNHDKYDPKKNGAGEDFLFMHHQMMTHLFQGFAAAGLPCVTPWTDLPQKSDAQWPVPGKVVPPKDDASLKKMKAWQTSFSDPAYLAKKSLSEIGYNLEISLHNNMHMRWTTDNPPKGFGKRPDITPDTLKKGLEKFDDPRYNWLADPYSAHVNPVFWKLHGLVELVIYNWLAANQYTGIGENCTDPNLSCYQWRGNWVGAAPLENTKKGLEMLSAAAHPGHDAHARPESKEMSAAKAAAPAESFQQSLQKAMDKFINGATSKSPGQAEMAPVGAAASAPVTAKEKKRRRQVVMDALKTLNRNSPMNRGALNQDVIQSTSSEIYDDPAEYVHYIEKLETSKSQGQ